MVSEKKVIYYTFVEIYFNHKALLVVRTWAARIVLNISSIDMIIRKLISDILKSIVLKQ
jgi:hypothetical protein